MKRRPFCSLLLVLAAVLACGLAYTAYRYLYRIPSQAVAVFGPPAASLSDFRRIYLANRLTSNQQELTQPYNPFQEQVPFQVQLGESPASVTERLQQLGLIPDSSLLRDYMVYTGIDTTIQAGDYTLSAAMSPAEIARSLQDATPSEVTFQILPGWRLEEIAESLPTSGLSITPDEFMQAVAQPGSNLAISEFIPPGASLEGLLYPGVYQLPRQTGISDLVAFLTNHFLNQVDQEMLNGFSVQGLDLFQAVILASIVQREAVNAEEMPLIASVFLNRLKSGWRLESDPTVQYALGYITGENTWWKNPLTLNDLQFDSPYNTYLYPALPPGPIANPGLDALEAVANPSTTDFFYFRAACDGSGGHLFARTFEEHVSNACP